MSKRKQPTASQNCSKKRTMSSFRGKEPVKSESHSFLPLHPKEKVAIKLGDKTLPQVETPTFLGVKLDTPLSWKPYIEDMEKKGIKKLAVL